MTHPILDDTTAEFIRAVEDQIRSRPHNPLPHHFPPGFRAGQIEDAQRRLSQAGYHVTRYANCLVVQDDPE